MFPDFNIYSAPLLVLVTQGVILSVLLFLKAGRLKNRSYFLLGILLLITCYHRTTYTIGFMGWYDTYRNTKINYYLISFALAVGPLIYMYIKSCVAKNSKFQKKESLHFIPVVLYVFFFVYLYIYDSLQPGFDKTANGVLRMEMELSDWFWILLTTALALHLLVYLIASYKLYYSYRNSLVHLFSNTYKYELNWFRNFLFLFSFLFVYDVLQSITDGFIFDLHWTQEWWYQFFSILVVIYLGVKGYFTDLESLPEAVLDTATIHSNKEHSEVTHAARSFDEELQTLKGLIAEENLFLNPNLSLRLLSQKSGYAPSQLSKIINIAAGQNFNDFVNQYRVDHVKAELMKESNDKFSILAIALDSGFNSKATFNRVFKKFTGKSPSSFRT